MTKAELIAQIAAKANLTKAAAERSVNAMLESIQEFLAEQNIPGIAGIDTRALTKILREKGTFAVEERQERPGRNPRTGESIQIAASKVVKFRPGKQLKDAVN